jgi:hypothetical protein
MTEVKNAGVSLVPMKRNLGGFLWDKDKSQSVKTKCIYAQKGNIESHFYMCFNFLKKKARVGNISVGEKIVELRLYLFEKRAFGMILSTKNELGWLFNLRFLSSGTKCCAIITKHGAVLYVDQHELPEIDHLNLVKIRPFYEFFNDIASLNTQLRGNDKVIMTDKTCAGVEKVIDKVTIAALFRNLIYYTLFIFIILYIESHTRGRIFIY